MTFEQVQAFNEGVRAVLRIASASAAAMREQRAISQRGQVSAAALRELAEAGEGLLLLPEKAPLDGSSAHTPVTCLWLRQRRLQKATAKSHAAQSRLQK